MLFIKNHIPEYFCSEQLYCLMQRRVRGMVVNYIMYAVDNPEDREGKNVIRQMILDAADRVGFRHCDFTTRIGYALALLSPRLCWKLYCPLRMVIHRIREYQKAYKTRFSNQTG